jgi:hypothetical protein
LALKNRRQIERLVSQSQQFGATRFQIVTTETAGRSDDANCIAGLQSGRTDTFGLGGLSHVNR